MPDALIPRYDAQTGWLPGICPKHGLIATGQRGRTFENKTPRWIGLTIVAGFLVYSVIRDRYLVKDQVEVPTCRVCTDYRTKLRNIRLALGVASVALCIPAIASGNIVVIVVWLLLSTVSLLSLLSSFTKRHDVPGQIEDPWLRLKDVHPGFIAALRPNPAMAYMPQEVQYVVPQQQTPQPWPAQQR